MNLGKAFLIAFIAASAMQTTDAKTNSTSPNKPVFRTCEELDQVFSEVVQHDRERALAIKRFAESTQGKHNALWAKSALMQLNTDEAQWISIGNAMKCKKLSQ